jgi:SAM-dependent methyltransferase
LPYWQPQPYGYIIPTVDTPTAAIYEEVAPQWHQSRGEANDDLGRRFRSQAGEGLVVDLGCRPGRYLAQIGGPVVGLDVSAAMLTLAGRRGHSLARADLESLPFGDGVFAGAFARHSYLHVPKERVPGALVEQKGHAAGGPFDVEPSRRRLRGRDLPGDDFPGRYFAFWTAFELSHALDGAGFVDIALAPVPRAGGEADLRATAKRHR